MNKQTENLLEGFAYATTWEAINEWNENTPEGHSKLPLVVFPNFLKNGLLEAFKQVYESAPTLWIPVEKEMPKERGWYLTWDGENYDLCLAAGNPKFFAGVKQTKPTHWMVPPTPPKKV